MSAQPLEIKPATHQPALPHPALPTLRRSIFLISLPFGSRPFFIAGLFAYAATILNFAFSDQVMGVLLACMVRNIASACMWLAARAMTSDCVEADDRGRSFGEVTQSSIQGSILGTVNNMVSFILQRLGVHDRIQAALRARQLGLI